MLSWDSIQSNAVAFSRRWIDGRNEEAEAQAFLLDFLHVFGVDDPMAVGDFEYKVPINNSRNGSAVAVQEKSPPYVVAGKAGYIDFLWKSQIAIEMKSRGKDLAAAFQQLQNYMKNLPDDEVPDLWMVCDFENIRLCRRSTNEIWNFKARDLRKHIKRFANIAGYKTERTRDDQVEVNVKAAEKMAKLHDALKTSGYDGHNLEVYLVRLLFCMFADDTGIFPKDSLIQYIENSKPDGSDLSDRIARLFEVLNMPDEIRAKRTLLSDELKQFRYINGKLFDAILPIADFDAKMRQTLIDCLSFDWSKISPAIFGAMFQGVMDVKQRREMGAHYTSEENILKLINPLFLDELWREFDKVKTDPAALERFHNKIARLKFLDPACGCGNFLIITYRELRLLELEILKMKVGSGQLVIDITYMFQVNVEQFYGIEYEDFPCQIAQVGMWLMDHQMNLRASDQFGTYYARLPLLQSATIVHGNALRIDWEYVVPKNELSYILGNPPFKGFKVQTSEQRLDMQIVSNGLIKKFGLLDYVCGWYIQAAKYIQNSIIKCAFVSTNSVTQGEQPGILWSYLLSQNLEIDFAYRTFVWSNEAKGKAQVHCVILSFSLINKNKYKLIFNNNSIVNAHNISPYIIDCSNILVQSQSKPICDVPPMIAGNKTVKCLALIMTLNEKDELLANEPNASKYIKKMIGADEFINNIPRYCLWLVGASPAEIKKMPLVMKRVEQVRQDRLKSTDKQAHILANTPTTFRDTNNPKQALVVPLVSSERRRYIPIGFIDDSTIANNKVSIIPNGTLYQFGILTSNVHNAWMRCVAMRMKSDYSYSLSMVYNTFPWPNISNDNIIAIEKLSKDILDARILFPDSSLADLYDPLIMPTQLLKAHQNLDRAVMKLYGFSIKETTEERCVAMLMERYEFIVGGKI